jgi:pimeloyl-ACP methyl ester carboxylesterase
MRDSMSTTSDRGPAMTPPIWREAGAGLELAALLRDPVWRGAGVAHGRGRPVLLVPGYLAGDRSLHLLRRWLKRHGYRPLAAGLRSNSDCASRTAARLADLIERHAAAAGERVAIIGQSRGGLLARVLAVRQPHLVGGIITLGSPLRAPLAAHPLVLASVRATAALGDRGARGLFSNQCARGACCTRFNADLAGPFPGDVGFVSLYTRTDGIIDWRACLDPAARSVAVSGTHLGMGASAEVYRRIGEALAGFPAHQAACG